MQALFDRLRSGGVPAGVWLVEIEQVRIALRAADDLLLRMYDAIISGLPPLG